MTTSIMRAVLSASILVITACGAAAPATQGTGSPDPLDSITSEELFRRGAMLARAGDFTRAEQYLTAAIDRGHPEDAVMPVLLNVCIQASRLVTALEYAEPYLARHPQNWPLRMLTATIHMGLHQEERARMALERVLIDAEEEPAQAHYLLGVLHRDSFGDYESARQHFDRYLALDPEGVHQDEARADVHPSGRMPVRVTREPSDPDADAPEETLADVPSRGPVRVTREPSDSDPNAAEEVTP